MTRLALCFALSVVSAGATQLPVRVYTTADGLGRDAVNCIVRDSRGFLWLCTAEGLSRFDGHAFTNYGVAQGLPNRYVNAFLETREGVYLAATDRGIARLDPAAAPGSAHKFFAIGPPATVYSLLQDGQGVVWAGANGGVYRLEQNAARFETLGPSATAIKKLAQDAAGNLWAGHTAGLCRRTPAGVATCFTSADLPADTVNALLIARDGRLWAGSLVGLWRIDIASGAPRVERHYLSADGLANERIHSLFESSGGTIWAGTALGLSEFDGVRFHSYTTAEGLSGRAVLALAEDREGNLWAGVDHGLDRIARHGFATFTAAEGIAGLSITELIESGGEIYAVSNESSSIGLHRYSNGAFTAVRPRYPASMRYFGWASGQSAVLDRAGEWWIATGEGVCRFPRVRFEDIARTPPSVIYTMRDGLRSNDIFRLYEDARGDIWITAIGGGGGPARWERATGKLHHYSEADVPGTASAYAEDRDGNLWIGFSNDANTRRPGGLARYRDGRFERFAAADGVPAGWIVALFVDHAGRLWIASSDGGLGRCDNPADPRPRFTTYTTEQGLSSISVRRIGEDRLGRIYAGTARALDRLDPATGAIRHYSTADGLVAGVVSSVLQDGRGDLWFGGTMGISRLSPEADHSGDASPVYITGLTVNGEARAVADPGVRRVPKLRLEPDQRQVHIEFVALGDTVQYQYKLEGADTQWSTAGPQHSVNYASLSPGSYRFLARTSGGAAPAEVAFEILPPVWRQWWFVTLSATILALMIYGAHRYHLGRELELERVRTRIATDLHDDLGASLTRIAILSEIATRQAGPAQTGAGNRLAEIADTARGLVDGMSDIVWAIDPRRDDMRSLVRRIRELASDTLEPHGIAWTLESAGEIDRLPISPEQRRNVFLLVKEAVHNAARHAQCSEVALRIAAHSAECEVEIRDNGTAVCLRPNRTPATASPTCAPAPARCTARWTSGASMAAELRWRCDSRSGRTNMLWRAALGMGVNSGVTPIRVAIVEDDRTTRQGLALLIGGTAGYECVGQFRSVEDALRPTDLEPDVILLDINLPGVPGTEGVKLLRAQYTAAQVVMLTVFDAQDHVFESICNGACGYLLKKTAPARLLEAIAEAHEGGAPMTPEIARRVVTLFQKTATPRTDEKHGLSPRELAVLGLLADGYSYTALAGQLGITVNTVRNHIRAIYEKLHVHSRSEAVSKALRKRMI